MKSKVLNALTFFFLVMSIGGFAGAIEFESKTEAAISLLFGLVFVILAYIESELKENEEYFKAVDRIHSYYHDASYPAALKK